MNLADKQLERLQLRPDRVEAIQSRRKAINARRDERLYSTLPHTDRLLDVGPMEDSTDETTQATWHTTGQDHQDAQCGQPADQRVLQDESQGRDSLRGASRQSGSNHNEAWRRFVLALAYAALVTAAWWFGANMAGGDWRQ